MVGWDERVSQPIWHRENSRRLSLSHFRTPPVASTKTPNSRSSNCHTPGQGPPLTVRFDQVQQGS